MTAIPKVSVLMAVYNTNPQHLREAIDSILGQTFADFEFLIINDASTNAEVEEVIRGYTDERIRYYVNEKNLGISPTRNRLMDLARGEYLAVMDHDDVSLPERLAKEVAYLDEHPEVGVVATYYRLVGEDESSCRKYPIEDENIKVSLARDCVLVHPAAMLRKSVLVENGVQYEKEYFPAEDYRMWCRLIPHTKFHNIPEVLFLYRFHDVNTGKLYRKKANRSVMAIHGFMQEKFPSLNYQYDAIAKHALRIRLFGIIPFLKFVREGDTTRCYLFNRLLLFTARKRVTFPRWF